MILPQLGAASRDAATQPPPEQAGDLELYVQWGYFFLFYGVMQSYASLGFWGENDESMWKKGGYPFCILAKSRKMTEFVRPQRKLSTSCGFVDIPPLLADEGNIPPPKEECCSKNMQFIQPTPAGKQSMEVE